MTGAPPWSFECADLPTQRSKLRPSTAPRVTTLADLLSQQRFVAATKRDVIATLEAEHARCLQYVVL